MLEAISNLLTKLQVIALQSKLIVFRSNSDPDLTISSDCSCLERSIDHLTTLTKISENLHCFGQQNWDFKSWLKLLILSAQTIKQMLCTVLILAVCTFSKILVIQSAFFGWVEWSTQPVPQSDIYNSALRMIFPSSKCSSLVEHKTHNPKAQGSNQLLCHCILLSYFRLQLIDNLKISYGMVTKKSRTDPNIS